MNSKKSVLIIEHAENRADGFSYFLDRHSVSYEILRAYKQPFPKPGVHSAIISAGGPMGVYDIDKYEFLKTECSYLLDIIEKDVPVLGVCLGHQILSHALGGEIVRANQPEYGWHEVDLTQEGIGNPLFQGVPSRFVVFQYHNDEVVKIPPKTTILAENTSSDFQAFQLKNRACWGIQFHAEVSAIQAKAILSQPERKRKLQEKGVNVELMISKGFKAFGTTNELIFENFFRIAGLI